MMINGSICASTANSHSPVLGIATVIPANPAGLVLRTVAVSEQAHCRKFSVLSFLFGCNTTVVNYTHS
jgi:hypothetical protein